MEERRPRLLWDHRRWRRRRAGQDVAGFDCSRVLAPCHTENRLLDVPVTHPVLGLRYVAALSPRPSGNGVSRGRGSPIRIPVSASLIVARAPGRAALLAQSVVTLRLRILKGFNMARTVRGFTHSVICVNDLLSAPCAAQRAVCRWVIAAMHIWVCNCILYTVDCSV